MELFKKCCIIYRTSKLCYCAILRKTAQTSLRNIYHNKGNDKQNEKMFLNIVCFVLLRKIVQSRLFYATCAKNNYSKFSATNRKEKCHCVETLNTTVLSSGLRAHLQIRNQKLKNKIDRLLFYFVRKVNDFFKYFYFIFRFFKNN